MDLKCVHKFDTVQSGHTQQNFCNATLICILFKKVFIPAWTLEETENVLETPETQGYEQAQDVEKKRQREAQSKGRYTF